MTTFSDATHPETEGVAFINKLKQRLGTVALAGALVPLAVAGMTSAAVAGVAPVDRSSFVAGSVTPEGDQFRYAFEVSNTTDQLPDFNPSSFGSNIIVNWELPLFSLNGIDVGNITSPEDWTFEIIDINGGIVINGAGESGGQSEIYNNPEGPFGFYRWDWIANNDPVFQADNDVYGDDPDQFEDPNLILHWYTLDFGGEGGPANPIFEGDELDGFSFVAADGATNAPYQASWFFEDPTIGDPPIPEAAAAIGVPNNASTAVPEPGAIALFATGLLGLLGLRRRRKNV